MAKLTLHFKNQEEYDAYWNGVTPGSKFLCIIDSVNIDESGQQTVANVLITSSNNNQSSGASVEMGTAVVETAQEQAAEIVDNNEQILELEGVISTAEEKTEDIIGAGE